MIDFYYPNYPEIFLWNLSDWFAYPECGNIHSGYNILRQ